MIDTEKLISAARELILTAVDQRVRSSRENAQIDVAAAKIVTLVLVEVLANSGPATDAAANGRFWLDQQP